MKPYIRIIALCLVVLLTGEFLFPGGTAAITISEEEEMSREFMRVVSRRFRIIRDPMIQEYINGIGQKILSTMPPQPFEYRFFVIKQEVYNAFAGPGGNIFINSGLIEDMESEDELAGIIAHEIIHVSSRHISQKIERSSKIGLATLAGMVAGIFLGVAGAGAAANAISVGSMAAGKSAGLAYSRQDEMQADELGIRHLTDAGYSGAGLLHALKRIRDAQWFSSEDIPTYLMTHPAVEDRIAYLDTWIAGHGQTAVLPEGEKDTDFQRARIRLIAAYGDRDAALRKMTAAFRKSPDAALVRHGYGIALARNDRHEEALEQVRAALGKRPLDAVILKDLGEISFMDGRYEDAAQALQGSLGVNPDDPEAIYLLGRTRMALEQYRSAAETLEQVIDSRAAFPRAIYFLGKAYGRLGELGKAHYYLSLYHRQQGDFENAGFHIRQAMKYPDMPIRPDEADTLLEDVRKEKEAQPPAPEPSPHPRRRPVPPPEF